jgi:hypothetical protein
MTPIAVQSRKFVQARVQAFWRRHAKTLDGARILSLIVASCHQLAKWRRRDSNPTRILTQPKAAYAIAKTAKSAALHFECFKSQFLATFDVYLQCLIDGWERLDETTRHAIAAQICQG